MFNKPREGREPELNIFIDQKFNVWNLPDKAKVVLVSNLPQVCLTSHVPCAYSDATNSMGSIQHHAGWQY